MAAPTLPRTIADVFARPLADDPEREALVGRHARYTYRELDAAAARAAAALAAMGVQAGDRVAASLPNDTDAIVAFHGVMRLGAVWLGVNRTLAAPEKAYIMNDAGASLLLADTAMAEQVGAIRGELPDLGRIVVADADDVASEWRQALEAAGDEPPGVDIDPGALAGIAYTSGTTGRPKGVMHSQYNLLVPGAALVASRGYDAELRKADCLALTILNMMVLTTLTTAQAGGCCIVLDRLDPAGIAQWVRDERATTWNGVPAMLYSLATDDSIAAEDLATLREVWSGGDALPPETAKLFHAKFGIAPVGTYGLTEAPTVVTIDPVAGDFPGGTSGRALPHLDVTIRDDDGNVLPAGEVGEVCVGPTSEGAWAGVYRPMLGYLGHDEATATALAGGVLHTGDLGALDDDGFLAIRSRRNAVIIRGGANVYPAEVERVILTVDGVKACAVFGVADDRLGQRVAAVLEAWPGAEPSAGDVVDRCRAELAKYKVPETVVVVNELPRNAMGKVERGKLAAFLPDKPHS